MGTGPGRPRSRGSWDPRPRGAWHGADAAHPGPFAALTRRGLGGGPCTLRRVLPREGGPRLSPHMCGEGTRREPCRARLWAGVPKPLPRWMGRWPSWEPRGEPGPQAMFPETGTGASRAPGQHPEGAAGSCVTGLSPLRPRLPHSPRLCPNATIFLSKTECPGWSSPGAAGALQTAVELQPQGRRESTDRRTHGQKDGPSLPAPQAPSADASPDPPARSGSCPPGCPPEPHAPSTRSEGGAAAAWCPVSQLSCPPWQSLRCPWHLPGTLCPSQARLFREESSTLSPLPPRPG